jgi:hypothetical protein
MGFFKNVTLMSSEGLLYTIYDTCKCLFMEQTNLISLHIVKWTKGFHIPSNERTGLKMASSLYSLKFHWTMQKEMCDSFRLILIAL